MIGARASRSCQQTGPGDKLHPNRAGYLAMAGSIDLDMLMGKIRDKAKDKRASR